MKKIILLFITIVLLQLKVSYSQYIFTVNAVYNTDTVISLNNMPDVYSLNINGQITLNNSLSFVRVIMIDTSGEKYLIYEGSKMLKNALNITLNSQAEETYFLSKRKPVAIEVDIKNAQLTLSNIEMDTVANNNKNTSYNTYLNNLFSQKLANINNYITENHLQWIAGDNPVARYTYSQKLTLFNGSMPDLQGFEYYIGGVFERLPKSTATLTQSNVIKSFDWTNRHGQDWTTGIRNQGDCGSCILFAVNGALETVTNLYFNRHINLDLSEQNLASCVPGNCLDGWKTPGSPVFETYMNVLTYVKNKGVVNDSCFHYGLAEEVSNVNPIPCSDSCSHPTERIKISNFMLYEFFNHSLDSLKMMLIKYGPIICSVSTLGHSMALVGYYTDEDNHTVWKFKNSWGIKTDSTNPLVKDSSGWCLYKDLDQNHLYSTNIIITPISSKLYADSIPICEDRDGDGYFNWGIGAKPLNCNCPIQEDCDDSNPYIGPFDSIQGNCSVMCNGTLIFPDNNNNIIQNETWNDNKYFTSNITVNSGVTLTVKSVVNMAEGTKITVMPGAKLIIDGGSITNLCGQMWKGIEVWGKSDSIQESAFYSPNQGFIRIWNGSIEHAEFAVRLWKPGDYKTTGGFIEAVNASFLNNSRSVELVKYQNKLNGYNFRNLSTFDNCTFKVDSNYRGGTSKPFTQHITLYQVNGVIFTACKFLNEQNNKQYDAPTNKAIYSLDAGFTVRGACESILQYNQPCPSAYLTA